jgi:predicted XRE-type DNA-binding protein
MNELRQYKLENRCLQKEIANKLGYSESKVTRLMKKHCSLRKILPMDEYERVMELLE